jgi:DNA polymerase-1
LIASFVKRFILSPSTETSHKAIIVAGDKDLYALVSDRVRIYDPVREVFLDKEGFIQKY